MTVIGWRVCWQQRYRPLIADDDTSQTHDSSEIADLGASYSSLKDTMKPSSGTTDTSSSKII